MRGGREFFGWGQDRHLLADLFDALNLNTQATGQWGKSGPPKFPEYPRPKVQQPKQKVTVASLWAKFSRR